MADPLLELVNHSWTQASLALMDETETRSWCRDPKPVRDFARETGAP